jgi:hypothetical protein
MRRMLSRFLGSKTNTNRPDRPKKITPQVETLEKRDLMAVTSATLTGGVLRVESDTANDQIEIRETSGGPIILLTNPGAAASTGTIMVKDLTRPANNPWFFERSEVQRIEVEMGAGDDQLVSEAGVATTVRAGDGNDLVETGLANDILFGGPGNDRLHANDGDDVVHGEDGDDLATGGSGNDTLHGDAGADALFGGTGNDLLTGGDNAAVNQLDGEAGDDTMISLSRKDLVGGGLGRDTLDVVAGTATVRDGENVTIATPTDQPQTDGFSCGPNSGSRLLRSYGLDVSYAALRRKIKANSLLFKVRLGTLPDVLRRALRSYKSDLTMHKATTLQNVLDRLSAGKPVIALIATRTKSLGIGGKFGILHYVVLNGFDLDNQTLRYVDTNGAQKSFTFAEFDHHWKWFDHFKGFLGEGMQKVLEGLGLRKRTILA